MPNLPRRLRDSRSAGSLPALSTLLLLFVALACGGPPQPPSAGGESAVADAGPGLGLPTYYRQQLRAEMVQIEGAMQRLLGHLVRGQKEGAAVTARQIHDSFILKRELSPEQLDELVSLLPPAFVERDRAFHATAAELAGAAAAGDLRRASDLYAELTRACVDCHATFARHRFPFVAPERGEGSAADDGDGSDGVEER